MANLFEILSLISERKINKNKVLGKLGYRFRTVDCEAKVYALFLCKNLRY